MREVLEITLDSEEPEDAELRHHDEPEWRDDECCLEVEVEREVCGDDEANAEEIRECVRTDEEDQVGEDPESKEDEATHVCRVQGDLFLCSSLILIVVRLILIFP